MAQTLNIPTSASGPQAVHQLLLQAYAEGRCRNTQYSLRAFAKKLKLPPSTICEIMSGKRHATAKMAQRIVAELAISPIDAHQILQGFPSKVRSGASPAPQDHLRLSTLHYRMISEWYHFAILSLAETKDFQSDVAWIAARLDLAESTIAKAIDSLLKLELMEREESGELRCTGVQLITSDGVSSALIRSTHSKNLDLARASLERDGVELRDFTAFTLSVNPDNKIAELLEDDNKKEVYKICVQLFPLTRPPMIQEKQT